MKIKKVISFFIFTCIMTLTNLGFAQPLQTGHYYRIKNGFSVNYGAVGASYNVTKTIGSKRLKANITQLSTGELKLDFWGITGNDPLSGQNQYVNSTDVLSNTQYYFVEIPERTLMRQAVNYRILHYVTWEFGLATIPFKYFRGDKNKSIPNESVKDFNAGLYLGRKWGSTFFYRDSGAKKNRLAFMPAIFANPSILTLDANNTNNQVLVKSNELVISVGVGITLSFRDINIGILYGEDFPTSSVARKWNYNQTHWIGFGLGYKLAILGQK